MFVIVLSVRFVCDHQFYWYHEELPIFRDTSLPFVVQTWQLLILFYVLHVNWVAQKYWLPLPIVRYLRYCKPGHSISSSSIFYGFDDSLNVLCHPACFSFYLHTRLTAWGILLEICVAGLYIFAVKFATDPCAPHPTLPIQTLCIARHKCYLFSQSAVLTAAILVCQSGHC